MRRSARPALALVLALGLGCGRVRGAVESFGPPTPTPTATWVGSVRVGGQHLDSYLSRVAEVDELTAKPLTTGVALREAPGRGAEPNGINLGPGERIVLIAVETIGNERFFQVRSFDGLRRGWLPESALAPQERPPR